MLFTVPAGMDMDNLRVYGSSFSAFIHIPHPQEKKEKLFESNCYKTFACVLMDDWRIVETCRARFSTYED